MPERPPKFKDMKVYPEPDDVPLASSSAATSSMSGQRGPSAPVSPPPQDTTLKPSGRGNGPRTTERLTPRTTERLTPKARMQLMEVEEIDTSELNNDSPQPRYTLFSSVGAYARSSMSVMRSRNSLGRSESPSPSPSPSPGPVLAVRSRPSEDLHLGPVRGRRAVHDKGGIFAAQFSRRAQFKAKVVRDIGKFVDGRFMLITSVAVTIYALVGDDLRICTTDRPADDVFNALALICLLFFTVEIILSSIGKPDYFLGFFFFLDLVATCSITLDLTWVSEPLMSSENLAAGDNARSGRTARLGATVGRVVRVLRLMRIVKLYRAYFEKMTRKAKNRDSADGLLRPGSTQMLDDWDNEEEWEEAERAHRESKKESAVGKKLVSLTTRRVIMMVLVMLMVLPYLRVDMSDVNSTSAAWGADSVWQAFLRRQNASVNDTYEDTLLRFLYYHNWYEAGTSCSDSQMCPDEFWMHPFWVGFAGTNISVLEEKVQLARLTEQAVVRWNSLSDQSLLYYTGTMPREVSRQLWQNWTEVCTFGGVTHLGVSLISHKIEGGKVSHTARCPTDLRPAEIARVHPMLLTQAQFDKWHLVFFFDKRPYTREESYLALLATAFICIILCVSTLFFSKDANNLVLKPVERMVEKVRTIANDPLIALKMADAEFELEEVLKYKTTKKRKDPWRIMERWNNLMQAIYPPNNNQTMETAVLEKTIIKLGSLLALGFGEAGANIVSTNMRGLDSSGVNAMIPGSRVDCIIGQAQIQDFGFATEVLQGQVMKFVNQIAEVVHGIVTEYHGAANKNMGDTFLLIWRISGLDDELRTRHADLSIISFGRILASIHESPTLARYRGHPGLQQRLGSRFRINLSFGLHRGWAIEGAVGSEFKIDASYLSPNVSISESVLRASKIYGVSLMISEKVIQQCSPALAQKCRLLDRVIIKGSVEPLRLYALDLDSAALRVSEQKASITWNTRQRFRARQMLEVEKRERAALDVDVVTQLLDFSPQMSAMRARYDEEFLQVFKMGFRNYEEGEWQTARRFLERTLDMLGTKDGPSNYLLQYMGTRFDFPFQAPDNWRGVHPLELEPESEYPRPGTSTRPGTSVCSPCRPGTSGSFRTFNF